MGSSFSSDKYKNDKKWQDLASWGKEYGTSSWGKEIVQMHTIHTKLFMGSRLSAQVVIDKGKLYDQFQRIYPARKFHVVCIASENTCQYCEMSSNFKGYDMQDRHYETDVFIMTALKTADHIHKKLRRGKYVLVHCHSGRNRSALAVLVYALKYTNLTYEEAVHEIKQINSFRFPTQKTLQNDKFLSAVHMYCSEIKEGSFKKLEKKVKLNST